ncbi:MAG: ATP synthase F1 subunit delta [Planctomycetota bacterium]
MPLLETPPDALAETYATSLFEFCKDKGGIDAVEETLDELLGVLNTARDDAQFSEFLASRVLATSARKASLSSILAGRISERTLHFLLLLNDKERLSHLPAIAASFQAMAQQALGRLDVDVHTASPISEADLDAIRERLASALGKDVVAHHRADPGMIGGLKLRFGDQLVDGSIAGRLRRLRDQLAADGATRVRTRVAEIIDADTSALDDAAGD